MAEGQRMTAADVARRSLMAEDLCAKRWWSVVR
jgi:hypothetical protein